MKYLILSKSNSTVSPKMAISSVSEGNGTLIDASDISAAKHILQKSLNKNSINQKFEIIDLTTSEKKYYVAKKNKP
jgi:hypothetical protein